MSVFDEVISNSLVRLGLTDPDGEQVVKALIDAAVDEGLLPNEHKDEAVQAVLKREHSASTALPEGIALPHGRTECVDDIVCMIGIHPQGVAFGAPDGLPTRIFVLLLVPAKIGCRHIHFLANLSRRLMERTVCDSILEAKTREAVLQAVLCCPFDGVCG
ncbi:MAG: PTS sugar transporter subunit IIA [Kiritimatiellae bacterium]|nr:PTS sugar transporter subunit IIA [Kiritimatiellia bacterium]